MIYMFLSNNPSSGDINSSNLPCSIGGWCRKFSNYMGHWCPTKSNYMGGWYFAAWKGKREYYLPKKERSFIKSSQKKA